jgi:hypothetical protein
MPYTDTKDFLIIFKNKILSFKNNTKLILYSKYYHNKPIYKIK